MNTERRKFNNYDEYINLANNCINDIEAWNTACNMQWYSTYNDINIIIDGYKKYLSDFPNGFFVQKAKEQVRKLKNDANAWDLACKQNTIGGYQKYLKNFSKGLFIEQAHNHINDIKTWKSSNMTKNIESYQQYLNKFPNGFFINQAHDCINDIETWNKVCKIKTLEICQTYLNKFPNGFFINQIHDCINDIETWNKACTIKTIESYQQYIDDFPNGFFVEQAEDAISKEKINKQNLIVFLNGIAVVTFYIILAFVWSFWFILIGIGVIGGSIYIADEVFDLDLKFDNDNIFYVLSAIMGTTIFCFVVGLINNGIFIMFSILFLSILGAFMSTIDDI